MKTTALALVFLVGSTSWAQIAPTHQEVPPSPAPVANPPSLPPMPPRPAPSMALPPAVAPPPEPIGGYTNGGFYLRDPHDWFVIFPKGRLQVDWYNFPA